MRLQWILVFALIFALIIAVFSVVNVAPVPVDYVFGTAQFPLIVVILGSALAGGFVSGLVGTIRMVRQNKRIRLLERELKTAKQAAEDALLPGAGGPAPSSQPENPAEGDDTGAVEIPAKAPK